MAALIHNAAAGKSDTQCWAALILPNVLFSTVRPTPEFGPVSNKLFPVNRDLP